VEERVTGWRPSKATLWRLTLRRQNPPGKVMPAAFAVVLNVPGVFQRTLLIAAALIPCEIHINQPRLHSYRGLSGMDCALGGLLIAALWGSSSEERNRLASRCLAALATCAFAIKTIHELMTGDTMFVAAGPDQFLPVPSAHLVGFLSGLITGLLPAGGRERENLLRIVDHVTHTSGASSPSDAGMKPLMTSRGPA
jgi:hypothetical protein